MLSSKRKCMLENIILKDIGCRVNNAGKTYIPEETIKSLITEEETEIDKKFKVHLKKMFHKFPKDTKKVKTETLKKLGRLYEEHNSKNHNVSTNIVNELVKGMSKSYNFGKKAVYLSEIPNSVREVAGMISMPKELARAFSSQGWEYIEPKSQMGIFYGMRDEGGFYVLKNDTLKQMIISFHGNDGRPEWSENVMINIPLGRHEKILKSSDFIYTDGVLEEIIRDADRNGFYTTLKGHSYGSFKARYFGAKYNKDVDLLNAHIMPWNKSIFPKTKAQVNFHTIIQDPTDFKYVFPDIPANENHFVYPKRMEDVGLLDAHYINAFSGNERTISNFRKYMRNVGAVNTIFGGLTIGSGIYDISKNKDPTQTISTGLTGGLTETGMLGFNIDSDYKYSDETPPQTGFDWLAYEASQPIKNYVLGHTSWGRERARTDRLIAKYGVENHSDELTEVDGEEGRFYDEQNGKYYTLVYDSEVETQKMNTERAIERAEEREAAEEAQEEFIRQDDRALQISKRINAFSGGKI